MRMLPFVLCAIGAGLAEPDAERWVDLPGGDGALSDTVGDAPGADLSGPVQWQADAIEVAFRLPIAHDPAQGDVGVLLGLSPDVWEVALVAADGLVVLRNDGTPGLAGGDLQVASVNPDGWSVDGDAVSLWAARSEDLGAVGRDDAPLYVAVVAGPMAEVVATGVGAWTDSSGCDGFCTALSDAVGDRVFFDGDGDGLTDPSEVWLGSGIADADSDDDGRLDGAEGEGDADDDGVPDALVCDADGDGLGDGTEAGVRSVDRHRDTAPGGCFIADRDPSTTTDPTLADTDGGGVPDGVEDADGDGRYEPPWELDPLDPADDVDGDLDGVPDAIEAAAPDGEIDDVDSDGDGIGDAVEGWVDTDGDGLPDFTDPDSDDDCLTDAVEGEADTDGDGVPDRLDTDSDSDGVADADESDCAPLDTDGDGVPDHLDGDSDGDGLADAVEGLADPDGDGLPALRDDDSDGDGLPDSVEGDADTDGDGAIDALDLDSDGDGLPDALEGAGDTDGDGVPDFRDTNSDGDRRSDAEEGAGDDDCDGLANWVDSDDESDFCDDGQPTPGVDTSPWQAAGDGPSVDLSDGQFTGGACSTGPIGGGGAALALLLSLVRRRRLAVLAGAAPGVAMAQAVDVQRHVPALASGLLAVEVAAPPVATSGADLWLDVADDPFVYRGVGGDELTVVGRLVTARVGGWVRGGPLMVGGTAPVHFGVEGLDAPTGSVGGDAVLVAQLSAPAAPGLHLGGLGEVILPTGSPQHHLGAGRARVGGAGLASLTWDPVRVSVALGGRSGTGASVGALILTPAITWGTGVEVSLVDGLRVTAEAQGERWLSAGGALGGRPAELLGSLVGSVRRWQWTLGAGTGIAPGIGAPDWRVVTGLGFRGGPL